MWRIGKVRAGEWPCDMEAQMIRAKMIRVLAFGFVALSLAMSTALAGQAGPRLALMSPAHGSQLQPRPLLWLAQVGEVCRIGTIYCEMHDFGTIGTTCCGCGFCGFWSDD